MVWHMPESITGREKKIVDINPFTALALKFPG